MTVADSLQQILDIKEQIHSAIRNKSVTIPNDTPLAGYPQKIANISGGGGSGYSYNCFNGSVQTFNDSVSYLNTNFNPAVLPNYTLYNGESEYVLMPTTNQYLDESGKYKKVKVIVPDANPYLENHGTTITNGVVSNFSSTSYVIIKRIFSPNNSWEQQWKFTTPSSLSTNYQCITGALTDFKSNPHIVTKGQQIQVWMSSTCSSWDISMGSEHNTGDILQPSTTYWVKVQFNGSSYILSYSTNGTDFTTFDTIQNSNQVRSEEPIIIGVADYNDPFAGTVDLNECWIKVNNEVYWEYPQDSVEYKEMYGCLNYTDDGSAKSVKVYCVKGEEDKIVLGNQPSIVGATIIDLGNVNVPAHDLYEYSASVPTYNTITLIGNTQLDLNTGIISNFSTGGNYAQLPIVFNPGDNTWEFQIKFMRTGSSDYPRLFALGGTQDCRGATLAFSGKTNLWYINGNGGWDIACGNVGSYTTNLNTIYLCKIQFTGTQYISQFSTDGINWVNDLTLTNSTPLSGITLPAVLGTAESPYSQTFKGQIYLDGCYLKIGNEVVWSGLDQTVGWTKK